MRTGLRWSRSGLGEPVKHSQVSAFHIADCCVDKLKLIDGGIVVGEKPGCKYPAERGQLSLAAGALSRLHDVSDKVRESLVGSSNCQ